MAGMFQRFRYDVTDRARAGRNILAVKIHPVDHPGTPDTQWIPLGKDRGYVDKQIMRDVTMIMTIGCDCMMTVPDRNMGIWQDVWIDQTGPVDVRHPFVVTDLPLPETSPAEPAISVELVNATPAPVKGRLSGAVAGTGVRFEQAVELGPNETKVVSIDPRPILNQPRLWWPVDHGEQHLYELTLRFAANGTVSDEERVRFGVREISCEMHQLDGWHGRRVLVNGRRIFCRGGYIQPELLFDWDARRMEAEIRYYARAHLNLIYFEDIPNPPAPFLELCDRYGVTFGNCLYSRYWLRPGTPYPDDFALLERCTVDLVKRYRNHPSLVMYMAMNEELTKEEVYEMWRRHILELDGTRWFIPSAYFPDDRKNVPEWFKKDLPTGMTDIGASYSWAEPEQYFRWIRRGRNWMFMMEGGSASLPPISSLSRFIPIPGEPDSKGPFLLDRAWAHHGANHYYKGYDAALRRLHGEPESVVDYCWKGHLVTADQHRSMFEAVNHRMWDITSDFTQWKINACEPSIQWQIFDWYHKPMVSWFYIKKACEPLHVQLNLPDRMVSVINLRPESINGLNATARVFDLDGKLRGEQSGRVDAPASGYRETFAVELPDGLTPVYFVRLDLKNSSGQPVSDNFYWLRAPGTSDYKALQTLPLVNLKADSRITRDGDRVRVRATISNPTDRIAFFVQLALTRSTDGMEALPVLWDDNYFSLLPGESRKISCEVEARDLGNAEPRLEVGGWNVEGDVRCDRLTVPPGEFKVGDTVVVSASISRTFLDGSRVALRVNGAPAASKWVWARDDKPVDVSFDIKLNEPGIRRLSVADKEISIKVR